MNEQDLTMRNKIEKREKIDTILAYVLLVILIVCIGAVLGLKFLWKQDKEGLNEHLPNYITLEELSSAFNSSSLVNSYAEENASLKSSVSDNAVVITYGKDQDHINLNVPIVGNELEVSWKEEDQKIVESIYKELAVIICTYYNGDANTCRDVIDGISENSSLDGIRFSKEDDTNYVYIAMNESFDINEEKIYNEVTKVELGETNYTLNLDDYNITDIRIVSGDSSISINGRIAELKDSSTDFSVVVKLYNTLDEVIAEGKNEFNENKPLTSVGEFRIEFNLTEDLTLDSISKYSIEIVK